MERSADVYAAFEILLSELAEVEKATREAAANAYRQGDEATFQELSPKVDATKRLRDDLRARQAEWRALWGKPADSPPTQPNPSHKHFTDKLRRGVRTQEREYRQPILQALVDLGGQAPIGKVLDRVHALMKHQLKPVDYEPVPSDPKQQRWRNAAMWERYAMVKDGLLRSDSPRGIWAISPEGRRLLRPES